MTDRTLSMMEYEDWRSPAEIAIDFLFHDYNVRMQSIGFQNIYPQAIMRGPQQLQEPGASLLDSLLGPGLL